MAGGQIGLRRLNEFYAGASITNYFLQSPLVRREHDDNKRKKEREVHEHVGTREVALENVPREVLVERGAERGRRVTFDPGRRRDR